ncbi:MAG: hypothetical protein V1489_01100 [Candidatus Liptonbacteria bacterium]
MLTLNFLSNKNKKRSGQVSLELLVFSTITVILIGGFALWAASFLNLSLRDYNKTQAFSIAEAGIEYYRWHLAHAPLDYQDGTGHAGPYVHDYYDKEGNVIGSFTLDITPPPAGSTVVTIESNGEVRADSSIKKIIRVQMAIQSLAQYATLSNTSLRLGTGTEIFGLVFSNGGIRFDGLAHNLVESAVSDYDDPDHGGHNEFGVHTHISPVDPLPPETVPVRPDVFMVGRQFPVPAVDFQGITQDLSTIRTHASSSGVYATSSQVYGYDVVLLPDGTYQLYKVTSLMPPPNGCTNTSNQSGWGTWSIQSEVLYKSGTFPTNGVFFLEDNVWVRGTINRARLTIVSGVFPDSASTRTSITINQDLRYTNYDGSDSLALIAQNNINAGLYSNDVLRIDAALMTQSGRVGRYYYSPPNLQSHSDKCGSTVIRQSITLYGMIGSNLRYGFGYDDQTGYQIRTIIYDANLLYVPPPEFPLSGDQYTPISWEEVQ